MNKFAKGSLAAGAGVVLLLGGAGTLAYWNDTAELNGGTINAGKLDLDAAAGSWDEEITTWVPGDRATFTTDLVLETEGDDIQGTIALDEDSIQISGDESGDFEIEFAPQGTLPAGTEYDDAEQIISFAGEGTTTIPVQVTVTFPFDADQAQNGSQGASVDLENVSFTATQTPADGAVTR